MVISTRWTMIFMPTRSASRPQKGPSSAASNGVMLSRRPDQMAIAASPSTPIDLT
jgi:hypothetical protein